VLLGVLIRLVLNRHFGLGRRGFAEAYESLAGQPRAGTGIGAGYSERGGRRSGAARQQEDQCGCAGSRRERGEEGASPHHGRPGGGLSCPSGQFAARNLYLLAGQDHRLLGCGLCQRFEWALAHLVNFGHGHQIG
jgi:hypothetical protein